MKFRSKTKQLDALLKELKNTLWEELTVVKRRKKLTEEINELWDTKRRNLLNKLKKQFRSFHFTDGCFGLPCCFDFTIGHPSYRLAI